MMFRSRWLLFALAAVGLAAQAQAGLLPINVTVLPESGAYRWTYSVVIPTDQYVTAGDYFTIYDFEGLTDSPITMPDGWSVSIADFGKTPGLTTPIDDPSKTNLTFTYNGDPIHGAVGAGNFAASSTMNETGDGQFTSRVHRESDNKTEDTITFADIPRPTTGGGNPPPPPPPSETPEPATLALMGIGLPIVGLTRFFRRKKA